MCSITPYDWDNGGYIDVGGYAEYGFTYRELMLFWGMDMKFKDKMMLHCFREVKGKQRFTTGI